MGCGDHACTPSRPARAGGSQCHSLLTCFSFGTTSSGRVAFVTATYRSCQQQHTTPGHQRERAGDNSRDHGGHGQLQLWSSSWCRAAAAMGINDSGLQAARPWRPQASWMPSAGRCASHTPTHVPQHCQHRDSSPFELVEKINTRELRPVPHLHVLALHSGYCQLCLVFRQGHRVVALVGWLCAAHFVRCIRCPVAAARGLCLGWPNYSSGAVAVCAQRPPLCIHTGLHIL